jgi:hypothetical protein
VIANREVRSGWRKEKEEAGESSDYRLSRPKQRGLVLERGSDFSGRSDFKDGVAA